MFKVCISCTENSNYFVASDIIWFLFENRDVELHLIGEHILFNGNRSF